MALFATSLLALASCILPSAAQLLGPVGPTTSTSAKGKKVCNIMDHGGVADAKKDNSAAIQAAWDECKTGGQGDYGLSTWLTLSGGQGVSINLEGTIYRVGTDGGNMIFIRDSNDMEVYSATSKGAIQGYGYQYHMNNTYGPRLLRFYRCSNFSVHDIALVDSPAFHMTLDTCTNGEVYNMIIRGGDRGGLDGIDVWGTNIHVHDVEVTNKDECVTVKNPSDHLLIEQINCNWSGGCAMGSLALDTDIHDIEYRNVYTQQANQMYMFKSNGGNGTVKNVILNNFIGHSNAYTLDFDTAWSSMKPVDGDGIEYSNISFGGWRGTAVNGKQRGPIKMLCPEKVPCTNVNIDDFNVWTEAGDVILHSCFNAYGSGACLREAKDPEVTSTLTSYTTTQTLTTATGYMFTTMPGELTAGLGLTTPIAIPTMPASFFPDMAPISPILAAKAVQTPQAKSGSVSESSVGTSSAARTTQTPLMLSAVSAVTLTTLLSAVSTAAASTTTRRPGCARRRRRAAHKQEL